RVACLFKVKPVQKTTVGAVARRARNPLAERAGHTNNTLTRFGLLSLLNRDQWRAHLLLLVFPFSPLRIPPTAPDVAVTPRHSFLLLREPRCQGETAIPSRLRHPRFRLPPAQ